MIIFATYHLYIAHVKTHGLVQVHVHVQYLHPLNVNGLCTSTGRVSFLPLTGTRIKSSIACRNRQCQSPLRKLDHQCQSPLGKSDMALAMYACN